MSEVIEDYIRRHPQLSQADAFEQFLRQDRIQAWVGDDATRRDRLHREFVRVWESLHPAGAAAQVQVHRPPTPATAPPRPAAPAPPRAPQAEEPPREPRAGPAMGGRPAPAAAAPRVEAAPAPPAVHRRRLQVLCASCSRYAVFAHGTEVSCGACGTHYDNMLGLIPVKPVGPFAYVFGEGWQGVATAGGIGLLLLALYGVLRWV